MMKKIKKIIYAYLKRAMPFGHGFIAVAESGFWKNRQTPAKSLNKAAALFNKINGKNIIEVGTGIHGKLSGNSMLVWAKKTNANRIIAIDLNQERLNEVSKVTQEYSNVELVLADGIDYLKNFREPIDLLYLDFWVPDPDGVTPGSGRADAYKEAFIAAKDVLREKSLILIDDTDHVCPWKHTYIIPLARENGYRVLYTGRQTLLIRE